MEKARTRVARRRVFYIPGYDPFHPRRYREIYRREGAAQAAISGYELAIAPRTEGPYGWQVSTKIDGASTEVEIEVLVWSDIVKDSMRQGIAATYLQLLRTAWTYIGSGALFRLMRLRKGPVIAALYPIGMLVLQLLVALLLARGAGAALAQFLPPPWPWPWLALLLGWPVLALFRAWDRWLFAYYLMHDYAFTAALQGANPPELDARIAAFAARIAEACQSDTDEVLVVGHSSGAHLAISALAGLARNGGLPKRGPALSLLTLGQVVPMVSFLPKAHQLRADLHMLAACKNIAWVDVTAPGDGCAFALCDPVAVSGVAPKVKLWPLVISAAFSQTLAPETWARLRWRLFRLHLQYLHAFDRPGGYDYFQITAGPLTLAQRFEDRAPSKSRIEAPTSPYISMAA